MEVEKRSSKGGFLQLFDWNLKSRKKLFSNKSQLSENLRHGKENFGGSAISQLQQVHEYGQGPGTEGNSDLHYHSASSLSAEDSYGTRAPGVVARLMGLDCLPTSNVSEHYNVPSFESQSFRNSCYLNGTVDYQDEHHIVIYESMRNKLDGSRNPLELRLHKVQGRPIERFQSEVLPRKSAKPISVTHNRLLSPIKSPGFIPPKNAAYIMEAAARIIEQSPQSTVKGKLSSFGSSSVPLRIQDLKEKLESAQKSSKNPEVSNKQYPSKHVKKQPCEKGEAGQFRNSEASKVGPQNVKSKEKSVSLAVQAKSNVQKRDGLPSTGNCSVNQKQHAEIKPGSIGKNQSNRRKGIGRGTSSNQSSNVLRQNNQKQNCTSDKNGGGLKPSASHQNERKVLPTSDITRTNKVVNKIVVNTPVGPGKTNPLIVDSKKRLSECRTKKFPGKRGPLSVDNHSDRNAVDNAVLNREERNVKCNISIEGQANWDSIDRKSGRDVVSFTFKSPIKKPFPGSSSAQGVEKNMCLITCPSDSGTSSIHSIASTSGINVVGADALSVLLEQKLMELNSRVEPSHQNLVKVHSLSNSADRFQDSVSVLNSVNIVPVHTKYQQIDLHKGKADSGCDTSCSTFDELKLRPTVNWKRPEELAECSSSSDIGYESDFDLRDSCPASSLEPSLSETSCYSFDSSRSDSSEESKWYKSIHSDEVSDWNSARTLHGDLDLADSACSMSAGAMRGNTSTTLMLTGYRGLCYWEFEYIRDIINNADLMLEEFSCGQVHQVIEPNLFDQLESQVTESNKNVEEPFKVARRALFDCVEECLELRCKQVFCGSFRAWAKWTAVCQRRDRLAEDLYREILGWTNMVDLMVDELVDKDMSSLHGKWVEFETETFEEGIDIEMEIFSSLVDELVDDFFF